MNQSEKTHTNYKIKNIPKFVISILIILLVIICLIMLIIGNNKINNTQSLDLLDAKKYKNELVKTYNETGQMEKFLKEYNELQTQVAMYILNNSTLIENSFDNIKSELQKEMDKDEWSNYELAKPTHWNGNWTIDNNGNILFKFENKEIEPNWVNNEEVKSKIILN